MATFFFDNDISFRIVEALRSLVDPREHEFIALRERFAVDTKDVDWIPEAGERGWVVVSRDHNQRRREAEHKALVDHNVKAIDLRQAGQPAEMYADAAASSRTGLKLRLGALPPDRKRWLSSTRATES